jgi:hypothetical protein
MLVGVIASNVLRVLDPADPRAVGVLFVGYFFQGVGFFMTMFYICIYILRCVSSSVHSPHELTEHLCQDHGGTSG